MGTIKDLTGQKFGRLKVIGFAGRDKNGNALWRCRCSCGNEKTVHRRHLLCGYTKSCGCLRRDLQIAKGRIYKVGGEYCTLKEAAKKTGLPATTLVDRVQRSDKGADLFRPKNERRKWRGRDVIRVEYGGRLLTLKELAIATMIPLGTLINRYKIGLRGAMLVRETATSLARKEKHAVEEAVEIGEYQRR